METQIITPEIFPNALPHDVFRAFMDSHSHPELRGAAATIDRNPR